MGPKVSIVVPVYNGEDYLGECLGSLVSQTLQEIEIICVNDGSTDGSLAIMESFAHSDRRVRIIDKANKGYGHSVNLGFAEAAGDYVGIVDADDYVADTMYEQLLEQAERLGLDFVKCDFARFWDTDGSRVFEAADLCPRDSWYDSVFNPSEDPAYLDMYMLVQPAIYNRAFLEEKKVKVNETPGASFQDNGFWIQVFTQATRALVIHETLYLLRRDNPNSSVHDKAKVYCMCEESEFILAFLREHPALEERFATKFSVSRFNSYHFTLSRIDARFKREFLSRFASDFDDADARGQLDRRLFTSEEWADLSAIRQDPDEYYYTRYVEGPLQAKQAALDEAHMKIAALERQIDEMEASTTWRVGRALTALPRWVKGRLSP